jgi:hypothetical protein
MKYMQLQRLSWIKVEVKLGLSGERETRPWSFEPVNPRIQ